MKSRFLVIVLLLSLDLCAEDKKKRPQQSNRDRLVEKIEAEKWRKQYMPFTDPITGRPYHSTGLAILATVCGPFMMLGPAQTNIALNMTCPELENKKVLEVLAGIHKQEYQTAHVKRRIGKGNKATS